MTVFKSCDVRGVVGEQWGEELAHRIGRSLALMAAKRNSKPICLGGDFRASTPSLKAAVLDGLLEGGARVIDLGQVPSPVVNFAARHLLCPNAVIVTASHNPGKYNGVKFLLDGQPAVPELMAELERGLDVIEIAERGAVEPADLRDQYGLQILRQATITTGGDPDTPWPRTLKVVLDSMGGAFTRMAPPILEGASCRVHSLFNEVDPSFAERPPNPSVDEYIRDLMHTVPAERADLGIALDGDGDRAALVQERGFIVRPEQAGALIAQRCFHAPKVVYDLKCASLLAKAVEEAGGVALMQPSGYGFIRTAMIREQADLGVEASGHFFFKALGGGDDGLFAALLVANLMAASGEPLSQMAAPYEWPAITPDIRIPFTDEPGPLLDAIAASCGGDVKRIDGVRAQYEDGWGLARMSITEPLLTLRFEARSRAGLISVARRFLAGAPQTMERVEEELGKNPT